MYGSVPCTHLLCVSATLCHRPAWFTPSVVCDLAISAVPCAPCQVFPLPCLLTDKQGTQSLVPAPPHLTPLSLFATALKAHQDWHSVPDYRVVFLSLVGTLLLGFCVQPSLFSTHACFWTLIIALCFGNFCPSANLLPTSFCVTT